MSFLGQLEYPVYFVGVILLIFFYGYTAIFWILKELKIKAKLDRFIVFVILVLFSSVFIEHIVKFLISWGDIGLFLIIVAYIATYFRYEKEMSK